MSMLSPCLATAGVATPFEPLAGGGWMIGLMYGVVVLWIALIVILLAVLIRRYTLYDPSVWSKDTHPFLGETFALPRGIFRGILTLSLLVLVLLVEIVSLARGGLEQHVDQLLTAFQMMLAFYFGGKVMHHVTSADRDKEKARQQAEETTATVQARAQVESVAAAACPPGTAAREFEVEDAQG